ncbi:hypothetical protein, partial [Trueperella sp. LYQ143]|uniref:DUF7507 domain-containing protein n=1 Tax=Trueperella sp. LYQ143 TaxID=3391059 RepID=UPI00398396E4
MRWIYSGKKAAAFLLALALVLVGMGAFGGLGRAFAADPLPNGQTPFERIYSAKMKGNIKITGNTLRMPDRRYYSDALIAAYGKAGIGANGSSMNNDLYMGEVDADNDPTTRNSSAAGITIAENASVEKAFLIWGGSSAPGDPTRTNGSQTGKTPQEPPKAAPENEVVAGPVIKFKTPKMSSYINVAPVKSSRLTNFKKDYTAYADVTNYVKEAGAGMYWAGDLPLSTGYDAYGGWSLVVVYADSDQPRNDLNVFFGQRYTDKDNRVAINLTGLVTPVAGTVHAKLGTVSWEGDQPGKGDFATVGKEASPTNARVYDELTPADDFGNSAVTYEGKLITDRIPNYNNNHGVDAKVINIDGKLHNGQDTFGVYMSSTGDIYYPTIITTEVELYSPDVRVQKTVENITRPGAKIATEGDILEYTVDIKNVGYDTATLNVATDNLPGTVEYIPGSIVHMNGDVREPRTDQPADDDSEYVADKHQLVFHIGNGATPENGGTLVYNQEVMYKYRTQLTAKGAGQAIVNTVLVEYSGSDGEKTSGGSSHDKNELKTEPQKPDYTLTKTADKPKNYKLTAGEVVTYTFTLKNIGNVSLSDITLNDPLPNLGPITFTNPDQKVLAPAGQPNDVMTATAQYTITQDDVERGVLENTVTANAKEPKGSTLTRTASVSLPAEQQPEIVLTKTSDHDGKESTLRAGDTVNYTFTLKNTGNVTVKDIAIKDLMEGVNVGKPSATSLAPGNTLTASGTYQVTQADVDAGKITNKAIATGKDPKNGDINSNEAPNNITIKRTPALSLEKVSDKDDVKDYVARVGTPVTYTFTVTNTGNVTVKGITLTDQLPDLTLSELSRKDLEPGQSATATGTYLLKQSDIDAGTLLNTASAAGKSPDDGDVPSNKANNTLTFKQSPSYTFAKTSDKPDDYRMKAGDTVTYSFTVTNTGNVTLHDVAVSDPLPGLSEVKVDKPVLAPGEVATATATYQITQDDVNRGEVENTATSTATSPDGNVTKKQSSVTLIAESKPNYTFVKSSDKPADYRLKVNDVITYSFTVTNTGNVTLHDVTITDPLPDLSPIQVDKTVLLPGEVATGKATYVVKQSDIDSGKLRNMATSTATTPGGDKIRKDSVLRIPAEQRPEYSFTKESDKPADYKLKIGDTVTYTFTIVNTGNVTLHDVAIDDPMFAANPVKLEKDTIQPSEKLTAKATYQITQKDIDAGKIENTATATATPPVGDPIKQEDSVLLLGEQTLDYTFVKSSDKLKDYLLAAGDTVTYTFTVTNTGNVTLHDVAVSDPLPGLSEVKVDKAILAPGDVATATAKYKVTQEDVDRGFVKNTATSVAKAPNGDIISRKSSVKLAGDPKPEYDFVKSSDKGDGYQLQVGDTITYSFTVTNTGNVTLHDVAVSDPMKGLSEVKVD